jgi:DeoR/GlpR family transcriptional regulator of sugar metabolism
MDKLVIRNQVRALWFHHNEMTQQQLADKVGVTRQTIVAIERRGLLHRRHAGRWINQRRRSWPKGMERVHEVQGNAPYVASSGLLEH